MTSLQTSIKQVDTENGYFITLGSMYGKVYVINSNTVSTASWAVAASGVPALSTSLNAAGAVLKDMGKTVVSSLRTFRKVQAVIPAGPGATSTLSTFGVAGRAGTATTEDYFTGYIELGFEGNGQPAPVAKFGR